jgi:hypothetical protein
MDPVTLIVTALAAGAAAGLKPTAEQVVKDAYAGLKAFIRSKYPALSLEPLEKNPASEAKRASAAEDFADAGANEDNELLDRAQALLEVVQQHDRPAAEAIGVDLEEVEAEYLRIQKVRAAGTGVKVRKGKFSRGIDLGEIEAGAGSEPPKE